MTEKRSKFGKGWNRGEWMAESRARREEIVKKLAEGKTYNQLAIEYDLSASRIYQIELSERKKGEKKMDRTFEPVTRYDKESGQTRTGLKITCSTCGRVDAKFSSKSVMSHVHAAQSFRNDGWAVGGSPRADKCPACLRKITGHAVPSQMAQVAAVQLPPPVEKVEKKAMDRTDKRLIFSKLNEVYRDEKTGYTQGWDDKKVAEDLGVPVEWVAAVRNEDFGPAVDAAALVGDIRGRLAKLRRRFDGLDESLSSLSDRFDAMEKDMKAMEADVKAMGDIVKG